MRLAVAIFLGKVIAYLSRQFKIGGGSAAPGLFALRIDPELVEGLSSKIPLNVVITGTNGKTTTARILAHFAKEAGLKVIRNSTGSNLERGIASALINHVNLGGGLHSHLGIWELDEFAFNSIVPKIKPDIIIFLNLSRDQLDRYGEVDQVVSRWCETLSKLDPKTTVLINSDDPNLAKLKKYFKGKVKEFSKKNIKNIKFDGLRGSSFKLTIHHIPYTIYLPIPGLYHIYDFLAAFGASLNLGFDAKGMIASLKHFSPAFGRVEKLDFGYIFLIKNPAGATQVFETLAPQLRAQDRLLLALNDNLADGTDVSWIWDVDFERLQGTGYRGQLICSGTRADDLANRLKYAGFNNQDIKVEINLEKALEQAKMGLKGRLFILPTYTAMLQLQKILTRSGIKKHYWEESL